MFGGSVTISYISIWEFQGGVGATVGYSVGCDIMV